MTRAPKPKSAVHKPIQWPGPLRTLVVRPNLLIGAACGVVTYFATALLDLKPLARGLIGWDVGVVVLLILTLRLMTGVDLATMKRRAAEQDQGKEAVLAVTLAAALASIAAIAGQLLRAKDLGGVDKALHVGLAVATITISWTFVQMIFALHYAHVYYLGEDDSGNGAAAKGRGQKDLTRGSHAGGLKFPNDATPDYWDFVHFAVVIGAAAQTADIAFTSRTMRRLGTVHSLIAFTFNTAILAVMINVVASLLQ